MADVTLPLAIEASIVHIGPGAVRCRFGNDPEGEYEVRWHAKEGRPTLATITNLHYQEGEPA